MPYSKPNSERTKRIVQTIAFVLGLWLFGIGGVVASHPSAHTAQTNLHPAHRALHHLVRAVHLTQTAAPSVHRASVRRASVQKVVQSDYAAHLGRSCRLRRDNGSGSHLISDRLAFAYSPALFATRLVRAGHAPRPGPFCAYSPGVASPRAPPLV